MAFRLRIENRDIPLDPGEFSIGRSSGCDLTLNDPHISRRHALLHITESAIEVEDLGSRNGVTVNGKLVEEIQLLNHMDRVGIGTRDILVIRERETVATMPRFVNEEPTSNLAAAARSSGPEDVTTRRGDVFELVCKIADKQMAVGRIEEAERILRPQLERMSRRAVEGSELDEDELTIARRYALLLAQDTGNADWLDWIFETTAATRALLANEEIDQLHDIVRKLKYRHVAPLRSYLAVLRQRGPNQSPGDTFLLRRIEALERVITA